MRRLTVNRIKCKNCGDVIESRSRHDFVSCSCGKCFVDGGHDYARRGYDGEKPEDIYEDLSVYEKQDKSPIRYPKAGVYDIPPTVFDPKTDKLIRNY